MPNPPARSEDLPPAEDASDHRWILIRDLSVFAGKAGIEALRDLVLIPVAFVVGLGGLLLRKDDPERPFREMLHLGRRFDDWLNLFGPLRDGDDPSRKETVDAFFARIESIVVEQHRRGGITTSAKESIDRALDRLHGGSGAEGPEHAESKPTTLGEPR